MKKISQIIIESRPNSYTLLQSEITDYINKVNKRLPYNVQKVLYLTQKYNLNSKDQLENIKNSSKGKLKDLVSVYNIPLQELDSIWSLLKEIKNNIRLLPQYQSEQERKSIEAGKLSTDDLTIDLSTQQGKNAVAKLYMPLVYSIVKQYIGKSRLEKSDLISAGLLGLTNAMNDWKKESDSGKVVPFKTYAAYRVKQQILNDINEYGHTLSGTNSYAVDKYGSSLLDAISIDGLPRDADTGDFKQDHLAALGMEELPKDERKSWEELYKLIDKNFSQRDCDIFYRFFGLNNRKREKSKDIAKSMGMSEGNIRNSILNKMIKWLKTNPKASDILSDIQDIYTEGLMCDMIGFRKDVILETLASNDIYILLEELNRWKNKNIFKRALDNALLKVKNPSIEIVLGGDFNSIDDILKKDKKSIILFLNSMYPTESFNRKTDVALLDYMSEIQQAYHKFIQK